MQKFVFEKNRHQGKYLFQNFLILFNVSALCYLLDDVCSSTFLLEGIFHL